MAAKEAIHYLKQLNHFDTEVRRRAILELGKTGDAQIYKILVNNFSDGHPVIREALFQVFAHSQSRQIAEIVADALNSPQISVKSMAMHILDSMGNDALFPLRRLSKSKNPEIRKISAELLGKVADAKANEVLLGMLRDEDEAVLASVISSLGKKKEIAAVPSLLKYFETSRMQRLNVLTALESIFSYWEKRLGQTQNIYSEPLYMLSFLNHVQEDGNVSAFNQIVHLLRSENHDFGDEILKALSAVLVENRFVILPTSLIREVEQVRTLHRETLSDEIYFTCLSRIPSTDAWQILLQNYQSGSSQSQIEQALIDFIAHFPSIFFLQLPSLELGTTMQILQLLIRERVEIIDGNILQIYRKTKNSGLKAALLELAAINQSEQAKQILLAELGNRKNRQIAQILRCLGYYHDESLFPLFGKFLDHGDEAVRQAVVSNMVQLPTAAEKLVREKLIDSGERSSFTVLHILFRLPLKSVANVLSEWLNEPVSERIDHLVRYMVERQDASFLPLIVLPILKYPEAVQRLLLPVNEAGLSLTFSDEMRHLLRELSLPKRSELFKVLGTYWDVKQLEWLRIAAEQEALSGMHAETQPDEWFSDFTSQSKKIYQVDN